MQQRTFATRKPQRRAVRPAEHDTISIFPPLHAPAGGDDVEELLAAIDAVLDVGRFAAVTT